MNFGTGKTQQQEVKSEWKETRKKVKIEKDGQRNHSIEFRQ